MHQQEHLVADIVYDLMGRFRRLPADDRRLKIIATLEAAAWVIATDGLSEMDRVSVSEEELTERNKHYSEIFTAMLARRVKDIIAED